MRVTQSEKTTRPAQPLIPVDDGRVNGRDWSHRLHIMGAVLVSGVFFLGSFFAGPDKYSDPSTLPHWRFIIFSACNVVGIMAGAYGVVYFVLDLWAAIAYQRFIGQYRAVELSTRKSTNNQETHEVVTEWDLNVNNPRDLIVAVVLMQHEINQGKRAPWAHKALTDNGLWFDRRKLAEVSDFQARELPKALEAMGYVRNRDGESRQAGNWTITPLPRDYSHIGDIAEAYGCNPDDVRRYVAMGAAVDRLRKGIGKVM